MSDATNIETREDSIKWKKSVEEVTTFVDGEKLPCILVENKIDLLDDIEEDPTLEEFVKMNDFSGGFRVSSKTGKNVNEAMDYLIKIIIKKINDFEEKNLNIEIQDKNITIIKQITNNYKKQKNKNNFCLLF